MSGPWMKFYPTDWRADPALRMCSLAARGLWIEMLCIMHESDPRGVLLINGKPVADRQLASLCGCTDREIKSLMVGLEAAGVFSREGGIVYSRRMRADTERAERDKANGRKGGNPKVMRGVNPPDNGQDKAQKPEPEPRDQKDSGGGGTRAGLTKLPEPCLALELPFRLDALLQAKGCKVKDVTTYCAIWIERGYRPAVVLAAVEQEFERKGSLIVSSCKYFDGLVARAHIALETPNGNATQSGPRHNGSSSHHAPKRGADLVVAAVAAAAHRRGLLGPGREPDLGSEPDDSGVIDAEYAAAPRH